MNDLGSVEAELKQLISRTVDLHSEADLRQRLAAGRKLVVKVGFDPTRPDLHLGHTVLLHKMKTFQDLGHQVIFVVGDFTASIGDPSGRNITRPPLTQNEIREAAQTYAEQAFKVLDKTKTKLVYNSEWFSKMSFDEVIRLCSKYPLARMMERDDFKKRWNNHQSISIHELLYPLVQAYDSVMLKCDVELGGTDQLFNLMVGRDIMREHQLKPQIVMTLPLLEGLSARTEDGKLVGDKMSKSLENYVGIDEPASDQFGKLMSTSDDLMWRYYELLSQQNADEIVSMRRRCSNGEMNPKEAKIMLAKEIVSRYHSPAEAESAHTQWEAQFSARQAPTEMLEWKHEGAIGLMQALSKSGALESSSEARRRIEQGGVSVDGARIADIKFTLTPRPEPYEVKAGKRTWIKFKIE